MIIDELLRASKRGALPPLAVGMGIYLPMSLTILIPIGALLGHLYDKWAARSSSPEFAQRMGVLLATGLIVGESLFGVIFAGDCRRHWQGCAARCREGLRRATPLALIVFVVAALGLYAWTRRQAAEPLAA